MLNTLLRFFGSDEYKSEYPGTEVAHLDATIVVLAALLTMVLMFVVPFLIFRPRPFRRLEVWLSARQRQRRLVALARTKGRRARPLLVMVNTRSGGQLGHRLLARLRVLYHEDLVFDLSVSTPKDILKKFSSDCRLLIAGGDGTVRWVLQTIDELRLSPAPALGILPLGTGNDLARTLGWGAGCSAANVDSDDYLLSHLAQIAVGRSTRMDRWSVQLSDGTRHMMVNYFSLGIDAQIALKFHTARNANPAQFTTHTGNIARYAMYGFEGSLEGVPLGERYRLIVDGKEVTVSPNWKGIVVCNVPCYHGGNDFWGEATGDDFTSKRIDDGKLEVMALCGTLHIGMVHVGMDSAIRVAQGKHIQFLLDVPTSGMAMQVDGEPWLQREGASQSIDIVGAPSCQVLTVDP
eukprot:PhM_4_TR10832/c0_g1_i1/m.9503/K00901/dgkA, DGK; diacylglycerol kinase (ATP)